MRLDPEARDAVNAALVDAHAKGGTTRGIAARFVQSIRDLERFGHPWVAAYLEDLTIVGANKVCSDWRRTQTVKARHKTGPIDLPAYVGARNAKGEAVQRPLAGLDLSALLDHRAKLVPPRDTLSREIAALDVLIGTMGERSDLTTAGGALVVVMGGAS